MQSFSAECIQRAEGYKTQLRRIPTHQVDSRPRIAADLCVSLTISHTFEVSCIKKKHKKKKTNHEGKFPADVCALSGGGQRGIKYTGLRGRTQRIQGDRHSITDDNDSNSVLTAREQKARLSVALLPRSDSSSLTDTDGGTRSS